MEELFDKDFEKIILESKKPVLIDFWAEWCPPCKKLGPILDKVEEEYKDKVLFYKLNVDKNPLTSTAFKIESIPTVVLFKEGNAIGGFIGLRPEEEIKEWLNSLI